ncbi:unnamed protein product, partial [Rotaria sp. Silwood1]
KFGDNISAQAWCIIRCIYFAYSSKQIRLGCPKRISVNFPMKSFDYVNQKLYEM